MRIITIIAVCAAFTWAAANDITVSKKTKSSVVKVFTVKSQPNFHEPWQNHPQGSGTGSGCVISGERILTNAHVVANATFIMVRKQGDPKKYVAELVAAGDECDLALLKVLDGEFYNDTPPLELGELPKVQDTVTVLGYPLGGDNVSVTEGVVSRIEPTRYSHSNRHLLAIQIDAAINPGNSGGPVVEDGKIIGVAFQGWAGGENMGYMVPPSVIKHFLEDVRDGEVSGFPDVQLSISRMENPALREWAGMGDSQSGVLVSHLPALEAEKGLFKLNDVIMAVDGVPIANDGTIPFREDEVIFFGNMVWEKYIGDKCVFSILRDGEEIKLEYPLDKPRELVSERSFGVLPTYYTVGGLLFTPLTQNYLDGWSNWTRKAPRELADYAINGEITAERDEIVVLSKVMADDVNIGYQHTAYAAVKSVNGENIANLKDLIAKIESITEGFLELDLEDHRKIVLDITAARQATPIILERYRINADRSADLTGGRPADGQE